MGRPISLELSMYILSACVQVRNAEAYLPIEATCTTQRWVECIQPIGCSDEQDASTRRGGGPLLIQVCRELKLEEKDIRKKRIIILWSIFDILISISCLNALYELDHSQQIKREQKMNTNSLMRLR